VNDLEEEHPGIPDFLKRTEAPKAPPVKAPVKTEVVTMARMSEFEDETEVEDAEADMPVPVKGKAKAKAKAKANGANGTHKPAKAAKGPTKAEAAANLAKAKAKGKVAPVKADKAKGKPKAKTPLDDFGFREGSVKSSAAAMYASKRGATLNEVKDKVGSIQLNLLKALEEKGHKVKKVKEDGDGNRQVTRYFLS
tara:strand:- start:502 stop:1086 length:585 start_codon:yes stop_codon:yes gene_type:complete